MSELVLIADDLTGTFDASVPFAPAGVEVVVSPRPSSDASYSHGASVVTSANTDSRHLPALSAYLRVSSLAERAGRTGARVIFKKTDSVLRGNVGAELEAVWSGAGEGCLHFIPAWPSMGRTTTDGIHSVNGIPVAQSAFGRDPFDPVSTSCVKDLIAQESDVPTVVVREGDEIPWGFRGIAIYDATSEESMARRVDDIVRGTEGVILVAGCSGVARCLASSLGLDSGATEPCSAQDPRMLAFCGSVNVTSAAQCAYAKTEGFPTFDLTDAEKFDSSWCESQKGQAFLGEVRSSWDANPLTVVDGSSYDHSEGVSDANGARGLVAGNLGRILQGLTDSVSDRTVLVIGGDALLAFFDRVIPRKVRLVGEVSKGVVETEVTIGEQVMRVLSKSGGFGDEDLIVRIAEKISREGRNHS